MKNRVIIVAAMLALIAGIAWFRTHDSSGIDATDVGPTHVTMNKNDLGDSPTRNATMAEVLELARDARNHIAATLNDYTADFVKQEADDDGTLGDESIISMKVQTRLRNETDDAPMRVYLKFEGPDGNKGREVIWGEDLYDGKMAVHEVGMLTGLTTLWLDPNGMVAMMGQKYPISEIGLTRLCEKLIERGEDDRDNPDVSVTITRGHEIDGVPAELIQVRRSKPSGDDDDDFSLAEISIDTERRIILQYRSFGWPEDAAGDSPPLQESYTYKNIKTNVGLTITDFDTTNSEYNFP